MTNAELVSGQKQVWKLLEKIGEGDAGEVYLVESLIERDTAILKRPHGNAFPSEVIRQASQIEMEASAIEALSQSNHTITSLSIPKLLDYGKSGTEYSARYFIVITEAEGFNLGFLARSIRFGKIATEQIADQHQSKHLSKIQKIYLNNLIKLGKMPDLLLLRAFSNVIALLENIHTQAVSTVKAKYHGILWNDIKPDHIYWDPISIKFTIIDWGNARFLDKDGYSEDRQHSRLDDHNQFLLEFGQYLKISSPDLFDKLQWPQTISNSDAYSKGILPLKERLSEQLQIEKEQLIAIRRKEAEIINSDAVGQEKFDNLRGIHNEITKFGEMPDYPGSENLFFKLAIELVANGELEAVQRLCQDADEFPNLNLEKIRLIDDLASFAKQGTIPSAAVISALNDDWPSTLWDLRIASIQNPESTWWEELSGRVRELYFGSGTLRPFVALKRTIHALQALVLEDDTYSLDEPEPAFHQNSKKELINIINQELLPRWSQLEPDPPDSGIEYHEVKKYTERITDLVPEAGKSLINALDQPRAHVKIVLDGWDRQDFDTAGRALRQVLVWDPDRLRLLSADRAFKDAPAWLQEVKSGPQHDESLQDFVTRLELRGREFTNHVGPAEWLKALLNALKGLRKGIEPTEVLKNFPDARDDLSWLLTLEPKRPLLTSPNKPVKIERQPLQKDDTPTVYGVNECPIGGSDFLLTIPLDTWVPEARGSSARVFLGSLQSVSGNSQQAAIKIMRPGLADYALPLFIEEIRILTMLKDIPGVTHLMECGYMKPDSGSGIPSDDQAFAAGDVKGTVERYGLDTLHNYLANIEKRSEEGWLPYLAIELHEKKNNLLLHCDTGFTHGHFMPILEGLCMGIQICDILDAAHSRNVTYRDHKILHYYWIEQKNGIYTIDWNIAKRHPQGLTDADIQFDLVQFGARALHYILLGRPAPGALPLGPNRPEEIEAAATSYVVNWTYDDQQLPGVIKDILENVLSGGYTDAGQLRHDLHQIFLDLAKLVNNDEEVHIGTMIELTSD